MPTLIFYPLFLAFFCALFSFYCAAYAQGEDCATATPLVLNLSNTCIGDIHDINMVGSVPNMQNPNPTCGNFRANTNDKWVKLQVPANIQGLSFSISRVITNPLDLAQQGWAANMAIYRGSDCNNLQLLGCFASTITTTFPITIATDPVNATQRNLIPGETLWVRVWERNNRPIQMKLSISTVLDPPLNDNCLTPLPLTSTGCNVLARGGDIPPPDDCGWTSTDNSVFYHFEVTSQTPRPVQITIDNVRCSGGGGNIQLAIYKWNGVNCNGIGGNDPATYHGCASGVGRVTITASPTNLPNGKYILAVDGESGANCSFGFSGSVVQDPLKVFVKGPQKACAQSCITFTDSVIGAPTAWNWTFEGAIPSASAARNPGPICYPTPGTYKVRLQVRNAEANAEYETNVTIHPNPQVDAGRDTRLCKGSYFQLQGRVTNGTPPYTFSWNPALYLTDSASLQPQTAPLETLTYTLEVKDQNQCANQSSVKIEVIENNLAIELIPDTVLCLGQSVELWAAPKGGSGNYTYQWLPSDGLQAPNSLTTRAFITESRTYTFTLNDGICLQNASVRLTIRLPFKILAPEDKKICLGDTLLLKAAAINTTEGAAIKWLWEPATAIASPNHPITKAFPVQTATYTLKATDGVCAASQIVTIEVTSDFEVFIGSDTTLCKGESLRLFPQIKGGSGNYTYYWLPQLGLFDTTERNPKLQPTQTAKYIFGASDGVCHKKDTINVRVIDDFKVSVTPDTTICAGQFVSLNGKIEGGLGNYSYRWFPDSTLEQARTLTPLAKPNRTTAYTLRATDGVCQSQASVEIVVVPLTLELTLPPDTHICRGNKALVRVIARGGASSNYKYRWRPTESLATPDYAESWAQPETSVTYTVTVSDGICQKEGKRAVKVQPPIKISHLPDTTICIGQTVKITPQLEGLMNANVAYLWQPGLGINDSISPSPVFSPLKTQTYTLLVRNEYCYARDSLVITVQDFIPKSQFSFTPQYGTAPLNVQFQNESNTKEGLLWHLGDPNQISNAINPRHTFTEAGVYTIKLIAGIHTACPDTSVQTLTVYALNLVVPNVFTPNEDGINDKWEITAQGFKQFKVVVWDRWGARVWQTDNLNDFWDGAKEGIKCPEGVYFYKISAITNDNRNVEKAGQLTLLR
jgi:gliding motility-associated-like protein